jgi:hypothetical protein
MGKWLTYYRSGDWKAPMSDRDNSQTGVTATNQPNEWTVSSDQGEGCIICKDGWVLEARPAHPGGWVWVRQGGA